MIKKMILWYTIFIAALVLNQTKAFSQDVLVKITTYGLWILLIFVTYVFYKEAEWEDWEKTKTVKIINNGCQLIVDNQWGGIKMSKYKIGVFINSRENYKRW